MNFYDHFMMECENAVQRSHKMLFLGDLDSNTLSTKLPECRLLGILHQALDLKICLLDQLG